MKIHLSVSRTASLLAVVFVAMLTFGCAIGRPSITWTSPQAPAQKAPPIPAGYKLVPDTAPAVASTNVPVSATSAPAAQTNAPAPNVPGLVASSNGYIIIKAPGFLDDNKVVSSGKEPYRVRFINALSHSVTVSVNHDTRKLEIPANELREINADSASTAVLYEVRNGAKLLSAGEVVMDREKPLATVIIRSP